jgi:acetoin utilization deacetylase AcuC-like enzyme
MTMVTTSWEEALDRFEARLDQLRAVLERDVDPVADQWPPDDITTEPIPEELVARAQGLLAAARELERRISSTRNALQVPPPPHHHQRQRPFVGRPTISADL